MANPHPVDGRANLRPPWGTPGNPPPKSPGRPPKRPLSEAYEEWLREPVSPDKIATFRAEGMKLPDGLTNADLVAMAMGKRAVKGDVTAAKELREAVEGKATQRIEMFHGEGPNEMLVVYATAIPGERELPAVEENILEAGSVNENVNENVDEKENNVVPETSAMDEKDGKR
jgi:hypothetical protein